MDSKLKLYVADLDWMGCIVVVSTSVDNARILMQNYENYRMSNELPEIEEFDIVDGLIYCNYGDTWF